MIASICKEVGQAGLITGGFYAATLTAFVMPLAAIGIVGAGVLWLYGKYAKTE